MNSASAALKKSATDLAQIDRSTREILAMTDLGDLKELALKARALEDVIRRSGKFTGTDYYRVATAARWAEWRGGQLLQEAERGQGRRTDLTSSQPATKSFNALLDRIQLKRDTAYRWITMAYAPESEVVVYMTKQEAMHKPIQSTDLVRLGAQHKPPVVADGRRDEIANRLRAGEHPVVIAKALQIRRVTIYEIKRAIGLTRVDKTRTAVKGRREAMRVMAAEGHTSRQIAAALGVSEQNCRKALRKAGVNVPADRVTSRVRHSASRIVERIVMAATDLTTDVDLIEFADLDRGLIREWIKSLMSSRNALNAFIKRLSKEAGNDVEAA